MFISENYNVINVYKKDIPSITKIYNSNSGFLKKHIGKQNVNEDWVLNEYKDTLMIGFTFCKIVDKKTCEIVGFMDFKIDEETYLSLFMVHSDFKNKGIGKEILSCFEKYAKSFNSKRIRIDVVSDYDETVLKFWINNGFIDKEEVKMFWNKKELLAMKMVKVL